MNGQERSRHFAPGASYSSPENRTAERAGALLVTVLFTRVPATLEALREAAKWASELRASIRILVPQVVPYPLPLEKPRVDPKFRLREFFTFCERERVENRRIQTHLDIRLCRDAQTCIQDALLPHSLVVIGADRSWWPLSYEKRLGKKLARAGHQIVFVPHRLQ